MRRFGWIGAIAVLLVLLFAVNMLAGTLLRGARLDVTEGRAFTLTSGSKNIARALEEPVKLTFYYSAKLAQGQADIQSYARRVRELLDEYVRISGGKVTLEVVDPEPFSEEEDRAVAAGLVGPQINTAGEKLYFGLVGTNTTDTKEVIPWFDARKERFLEYDITKLLYSLDHPKKKVVGLISPLQIQGGMTFDQRTRQPQRTPAWQVIEQARTLFEVKAIPVTSKEIGADVDVLMVVHPKNLSEEMLYAIDQFVMKGGKAMVFVDPNCENDDQAGNPMMGQSGDRASNLPKLLDAWGVELVQGKLAADRNLALPVMMNNQQVSYVAWIRPQAKEGNFNREDPITADLKIVHFATAGVIRQKSAPAPAEGQTPPPEGPKATITPLISTTKEAMQLPVDALGLQPDPKALMGMYVPGIEPLVIAARLGGEVNSAFPNGAPPATPPTDGSTPPPPPGPGLTKSSGPINVVLVADVDVLADGLWARQMNLFGQNTIQKMADNGDMVLSALDNLCGSADLISVRARKEEARPFTRVEKMRQQAERDYADQEKAIVLKLETTQKKIEELQAKRGDDQNPFVLTPEQEKEIEAFRQEFVKTRKELRAVRLGLNKGIESLGTQLKFVNIGLVPALVSIGALGLAGIRAARRRASKS